MPFEAPRLPQTNTPTHQTCQRPLKNQCFYEREAAAWSTQVLLPGNWGSAHMAVTLVSPVTDAVLAPSHCILRLLPRHASLPHSCSPQKKRRFCQPVCGQDRSLPVSGRASSVSEASLCRETTAARKAEVPSSPSLGCPAQGIENIV